jgi:hypothetical protein
VEQVDVGQLGWSAMHDPQKHWLQKLQKLNPNVKLAKGPGAARFAPHKLLRPHDDYLARHRARFEG